MAHSYTVWNGTDNIPAHYDFFPSVKSAKEWIRKKRQMFKDHQGFYHTNRRERISPDDIIYEVHKRY